MKLGTCLIRQLTSATFFLLAVATSFAQGGFQQPTGVPPLNVDASKVKIIQRIGNQIPTATAFVDQFGKQVTFGEVLGKRPALVLAIFYRCTGVCGVELARLVAALGDTPSKRIGRDFDVIVVGIDPLETPELANAKLRQTLATSPELKGTDAGWHFLTGKLTDIQSVTNSMGFYYTFDPGKDVVNHAAGLMFVTPTGVVSSYILGARYSSDVISANLDTAAKGQLGIKSPDIFFGCFHVDPLTGKVSVVIENVIRLGAVVTVVSLLLTVLTLSGKTRWKKRTKKTVDEWGEPLVD